MLDGYRLLTAYIVLAYLAQGIAEHFCLPSQPINNFFVKSQNWDPTRLAAYLALLMVPWTIKPVFGAISDIFQLGQGSKRSYLTIVFFISACGYFIAWLSLEWMTVGLLLAACGLAWGTALLLGLIIEKYPSNLVPYIFSMHFIAYYSASISSGLAGGALCQYLTPEAAVKAAFAICCGVSLLASLATPFWISKDSSQFSVPKHIFADAARCVKSKNFWLLAGFIYLWSFTPASGTPLYFQYSKILQISQEQIGQANAAYSLGMVSGAFIYPAVWRFFPKYQVVIATGCSISSSLCFLTLTSENYIFLEVLRGIASMLGVLCINWLAAGLAPKGLETFATASLIAVYNVGTQTSGVAGAYLYAEVFSRSLNPLLLVSALIAAASLLFYFPIDQNIRSTERC